MAKIGNRDPKAVSLDSFFAIMPRHTKKVGVYMNNIAIFNNPEFGDIRTEVISGEPWFCLSDICKALELEQVSRVKTRLNLNGVTTSKVIDRMGRKQEATFINEANLYKTIFQSRKESAERFSDWVTSEVLPSIRRTGSYSINERKPDSYMMKTQLREQNAGLKNRKKNKNSLKLFRSKHQRLSILILW